MMTMRSLFPAILGAVLVSSAAADERVDRLTEEHKTWLEQEVVYIITERERDVFLSTQRVMLTFLSSGLCRRTCVQSSAH